MTRSVRALKGPGLELSTIAHTSRQQSYACLPSRRKVSNRE
jgi:hypothetical protein